MRERKFVKRSGRRKKEKTLLDLTRFAVDEPFSPAPMLTIVPNTPLSKSSSLGRREYLKEREGESIPVTDT